MAAAQIDLIRKSKPMLTTCPLPFESPKTDHGRKRSSTKSNTKPTEKDTDASRKRAKKDIVENANRPSAPIADPTVRTHSRTPVLAYSRNLAAPPLRPIQPASLATPMPLSAPVRRPVMRDQSTQTFYKKPSRKGRKAYRERLQDRQDERDGTNHEVRKVKKRPPQRQS